MNIKVCISFSVKNKFCAVDIFWIITRRQAISFVAKFYHTLGHDIMIQQVILLKMLIAWEGNMGNCHPEKTKVDWGEALEKNML